MSQRARSNTLYARLPGDVMERLRTFASQQGMTLSAAAAELIRRGLARNTGGYQKGYAAGFSQCLGLVDLVANAGERAEQIRELGDQVAAAMNAARGAE